MPLLESPQGLRNRLIKIAIALLIATVAPSSLPNSSRHPHQADGCQPAQASTTEVLINYMKVASSAG